MVRRFRPSSRREGLLLDLLSPSTTPSATCPGSTGMYLAYRGQNPSSHSSLAFRMDPALNNTLAIGNRNVRNDDGTVTGIPVLKCNQEKKHVGYQGAMHYFHEPRNTFQIECRRKRTTNLQQYTRVLLPGKIERWVSIEAWPPPTNDAILALGWCIYHSNRLRTTGVSVSKSATHSPLT
jgi:hypothetical protein